MWVLLRPRMFPHMHDVTQLNTWEPSAGSEFLVQLCFLSPDSLAIFTFLDSWLYPLDSKSQWVPPGYFFSTWKLMTLSWGNCRTHLFLIFKEWLFFLLPTQCLANNLIFGHFKWLHWSLSYSSNLARGKNPSAFFKWILKIWSNYGEVWKKLRIMALE